MGALDVVLLGVGSSFAGVLAWAGAQLRFRERHHWVAGYNAALPEQKKQYDIEGLSHHLGNGLMTLGALLAAATVAVAFDHTGWVVGLMTGFVFVAAIIVVGGQKFLPAARFPAEGESGHTVHRIVRRLLPESAYRALEAGTRQWQYECRCGHTKDFWETGGIRYQAWGEPRMLLPCERCGETSMQKVRRKPTSATRR